MEIKDFKVEEVWFDETKIFIRTDANEIKSHPLSWFPKLEKATKEQLKSFELSPFGIHWPALDEDLSFEGFFNYSPKMP